MSANFEADLAPETLSPRIRFNFDNGWTASVVLDTGLYGTDANTASVVCWPTGHHGTGKSELLATEAFADEVAHLLEKVSQRQAAGGAA